MSRWGWRPRFSEQLWRFATEYTFPRSARFPNSSQRAVWPRRQGLWFATRKGVVGGPKPFGSRAFLLQQSSLKASRSRTAKNWSTDANLVIGPGLRRLTIHYTFMSLVAGDRVRFRYRMEGLDNDWVDAGASRVAEYTHLPPGSYRFRVSACNDEGEWNVRGTGIGIELRPFFYQTYWFYAVSGLSLILCIAGGYWLRVQGLRRQYAALARRRTHSRFTGEIAGRT